MYMRFTIIFSFIVLFFTHSLAISQTGNETINEWEDIILLKSGTSFRGIIFEQIPNKYYKIRLHDGTVLEFESFLVDIVTRQPKVKLPELQQEEPKDKNVPIAKIYDIPIDTPLKSLWLTIGPSVHLGIMGWSPFGLFPAPKDAEPVGLMYGIGIDASVGTKISDKMYAWGALSTDFNKVLTSYTYVNSNDVAYSYTSKMNRYSISVGLSHKITNFFLVLELGQAFGECWIPEHFDIDGYTVPEKYISDSYSLIGWGVIIPLIEGSLSASGIADISGLFGSVNLNLKFGLVYTPNF